MKPPGDKSTTTLAYDIQGVNKVFPGASRVQALENIDLQLTEGSFTCIVGPSGCGKSTLLRILGGLETATSGTIESSLQADRVPEAAFVFQEHGVFPWFTVLQNVAFGEQMASVARAFATGSPALLMDEPLGALDAQTRMLMQEQLTTLWEQERKTVVLVTHSIEEALLLGDAIVMMSSRPGRVKEIIPVPFERPRRMDIEADPLFTKMKQDIWDSLRDEVQASLRYS